LKKRRSLREILIEKEREKAQQIAKETTMRRKERRES